MLIRNIKLKSGPDSFLEWLHVLMLMDDTVIFASSRERMVQKLDILLEYCVSHGMVMNESKTKFFVINGDASDKEPFPLGDILIKLCERYVYLGAIFTADGSTASSLSAHAKEKRSQLNKLLIFFRNNPDMPFFVKRKVLEAAFNSSILYGCESWLDVSLRKMEVIYMSAIRALLGVRKNIPNDICLIEAGMPSLESLVKQKQQSFFKKMMLERSDMIDDPLIFMLDFTKNKNPKMYSYIENVINVFYMESDLHDMTERVRNSEGTRFKTYLSLNPSLSMHDIYSRKARFEFVPEHYRIEFTRLRLSSHRLRVETGRWSRMNREDRCCQTCDNGDVQDESHIFTSCLCTYDIRNRYNREITFPDIITNALYIYEFKLVHDVMKCYS